MAAAGLTIAPHSINALGSVLYYLSLVLAVGGCILGTIGSAGLLVKRLVNADMRAYATPSDYFGYAFFLVLFVSGLFMWYFDPTLANYRDFFKSMGTFQSVNILPATYAFIIIFALHMIHLPFTRSTHYITKLFTFFGILWNDKPNLVGSGMEKKINAALNQKVGWSAPHIQTGKTWAEVATELPASITGKATK